MGVAGDLHDRLRKPEYTGENRCLPCTVVNLVIALVVAFGLASVRLSLGVAFLVLALSSIWLRGYLVPGTPELTQRYFPEWLLAVFDKAPKERIDEVDPESTLAAAGVIEPCQNEDDVCLADAFREAWRSNMTRIREGDTEREAIARHLDVDPDALAFESHGDAYVARHDGRRLGQWESRPALLADLATVRVLPEWIDDWEALSAAARTQLMNGLRIFLERCPGCDGAVTLDTEVVSSCCRSQEVVTASCDDCGARLLESPYES